MNGTCREFLGTATGYCPERPTEDGPDGRRFCKTHHDQRQAARPRK